MKTRPILFSTDMVQAILCGSKTQTRRVVKDEMLQDNKYPEVEELIKLTTLPKYYPGDILWVRETWHLKAWDFDSREMLIKYKNGDSVWRHLPDDEDKWILKQIDQLEEKGCITARKLNELECETFDDEGKYFKLKEFPWKPSIFMPKEACRIFLEITEVRVERLQEISEADAKAEGVIKLDSGNFKNYYSPLNNMMKEGWPDAYHSFQSLWEEINGTNSFEENQWVWVVTFKQIEKPEGWPK